MSHFVRMFKPQFADLVASGKKLQTVRPLCKRMPKKGDTISLRKWSGAPYRSKQVVLCNSIIRDVRLVKITEKDGGCHQTSPSDGISSHDFARADGFKDFFEMRDWFKSQHTLPFVGIVIYWEPPAKAHGCEVGE